MTIDLRSLRKEYTQSGLTKSSLDSNPIKQFETWFGQVRDAGIVEPNAMSLTTVGAKGEPSVRTVLLKGYDDEGFVFYTNYQSAKARDIEENNRVALLFPWLALERQVIIRGIAEKVSTERSLEYFSTRPRGSQLGAWVSEQSKVLTTRASHTTSNSGRGGLNGCTIASVTKRLRMGTGRFLGSLLKFLIEQCVSIATSTRICAAMR